MCIVIDIYKYTYTCILYLMMVVDELDDGNKQQTLAREIQ